MARSLELGDVVARRDVAMFPDSLQPHSSLPQ